MKGCILGLFTLICSGAVAQHFTYYGKCEIEHKHVISITLRDTKHKNTGFSASSIIKNFGYNEGTDSCFSFDYFLASIAMINIDVIIRDTAYLAISDEIFTMENLALEIYDIEGKLIEKHCLHCERFIDLSNLTNNCYVYRIIADESNLMAGKIFIY